ncbi:hypothetical protein HWQ46_26040 [Shewanella sp. D64]|uniref:hypothetical protein n=1 Tax=unclassified Shewanella TaxID=196818 RepID=UPI0022BA3180|nr:MULTISPECIES: hypothetical protein [unclassified Shewanella]MEC4728977.1 hypothetical protein [Shewanella sp. D64]MEC4740821.1 hypothetical protein [Shewanella sp. E94]WBJ94783.1 hypothetical protein HWQ47_23500 [Shewanella sp. MTB7]
MLIERDGQIIQIRASALGDLIKVVILQVYGKLDDFKERYDKYGGMHLSKEQIDTEWPNWTSRWIVAQTFTAMALEAFYYDYIQNEVSKTQAEKKRTPPERFQYICSQHLGIDNEEIAQCLDNIAMLNVTRNHWIHNKSAEFDKYQKVKTFYSPDECVQLLIDVFTVINKHDLDCVVARETCSILEQVQQSVINEVDSLKPHNKSINATV